MSLAAIATPGLTFHDATHRYMLDGEFVPSVTQVIKDNRLSADFSHVNRDVLERNRAIGVAVHAAAHYFDEGDLDESSVDPDVRPYLEAWKAFVYERKVEMLALEQRVADPVYRLAGTIDRIARVPGISGELVIDIKKGDPKDAGANYQTAAYALLAANLGIIAKPFLIERWSVQLHPERAVPYTVSPYRSSADRRIFLAALQLTHERERLGRSSWMQEVA